MTVEGEEGGEGKRDVVLTISAGADVGRRGVDFGGGSRSANLKLTSRHFFM